MACSKDAGEWLFGKQKNVFILKNAIDIEKYNYNEEKRKIIRNNVL